MIFGRKKEPILIKTDWTLWREPVRKRWNCSGLLLGREDLERLTSEQRHRAQRLRIELEGCPSTQLSEEMARTIAPVMPLSPHALRIADVEALEQTAYAVRSRTEVERELPVLIARLKDVDPAVDAALLVCDGERWEEGELRSVAKLALAMIYEREAADISQARKRYDLLRFTGNTAAVMTAAFVWLVSTPDPSWISEGGHVIVVTMLVGGLGGIMSAFVTLGDVTTVRGLSRASMNTSALKFTVLAHSIGGFVFSLVMLMLLLGGFLQGTILPDMKTLGALVTRSESGLSAPVDFFTTEMAKLIVWSFVAGYLGGLVPSQIAKLGSGLTAKEAKATPS